MLALRRGMRDKLEKYLRPDQPFAVEINVSGPAVYDYSCFGVDANDKLADDRYMIFYNQTAAPNEEIRFANLKDGASFAVNLARLPNGIAKLVFTVSIDGEGSMGQLASLVLRVRQNSAAIMELALNGADFQQEKAIILIEIYKKDGWRIAAVARGFNGGLGDLLRSFGGEEIVAPAPKPEKISLEKKLEKSAPQLVSLAKPLTVELKKKGLENCAARVGLVMDISGSMDWQYENGAVQQIVNKTLPLAVQFDDDGELDFWYYATTYKRMPSVNMQNYQKAVPDNWESLMASLGGGTNPGPVMKDVIKFYKDSKLPAYVLFITDGEFSARDCEKILREASHFPIFWQFVGVGGSSYGVLQRLDTLQGRYVDNANFFALDDFKNVPNNELYSRLLGEFPQWLREIKQKNML